MLSEADKYLVIDTICWRLSLTHSEVTPEKELKADLGVDGALLLKIASDLEAEFRMKIFDEPTLRELVTVQDICDRIDKVANLK